MISINSYGNDTKSVTVLGFTVYFLGKTPVAFREKGSKQVTVKNMDWGTYGKKNMDLFYFTNTYFVAPDIFPELLNKSFMENCIVFFKDSVKRRLNGNH